MIQLDGRSGIVELADGHVLGFDQLIQQGIVRFEAFVEAFVERPIGHVNGGDEIDGLAGGVAIGDNGCLERGAAVIIGDIAEEFVVERRGPRRRWIGVDKCRAEEQDRENHVPSLESHMPSPSSEESILATDGAQMDTDEKQYTAFICVDLCPIRG